jgi:hypothetical protein
MKFLEKCPVDIFKIVEIYDPGFTYFNFEQNIVKTIETETKLSYDIAVLVYNFCPIKRLFELDNAGFLMCADNEEEIENLFRIEEEEGKADSSNSLKSLLTNCGVSYDWNVHLVEAGLWPGHSTYPPGYVRDIKLLPLQDNYRISIKEEEDIPADYYYYYLDYKEETERKLKEKLRKAKEAVEEAKFYCFSSKIIKKFEEIARKAAEAVKKAEEEGYRLEFATITCAFTDVGYAGWIEDTDYSRAEIEYYLGKSSF